MTEADEQRLAARRAAMDLLARRDHSRLELSQKLSRHSDDPSLIQEVIDQLEHDNLFSEQRFTEIFVRSKVEHGFGPFRIRQDLKAKGVAAELIEQTFSSQDIDWLTHARRVYLNRIKHQGEMDSLKLQKQARYLHSRGYDGDTVKRAMDMDDEFYQ
ncbi:MAG: regulatory protein RecX [Pseudomonadales bacterium]